MDDGSGASDARSTVNLWVNGMSCPLCAINVDKQLLAVPGVSKVLVDLGSGKVTVHVARENPPTRDQLSKAVEESGYTLVRFEQEEAVRKPGSVGGPR